jgi:hypothetical protein
MPIKRQVKKIPTRRQWDFLERFNRMAERNGRAPTPRELAKEMKIKGHRSAFLALKELTEMGFLERPVTLVEVPGPPRVSKKGREWLKKLGQP